MLLAMVEHPEAFHVENATASDNAVSALGKLCYSNEGIARHVLPRWLAKLPLRADRWLGEPDRAWSRSRARFCTALRSSSSRAGRDSSDCCCLDGGMPGAVIIAPCFGIIGWSIPVGMSGARMGIRGA